MKYFLFLFCFLCKISFTVNFQDKKGNYFISNLSSWRTTKINDSTYKFKGAGSPLKAVCKLPNIILTAQEVEGILQIKPISLISQIEVKKDINMVFVGIEKRQTQLVCSILSYNASSSQILLPSSFKLNSIYQPQSQTIMIEGKSGEIFLYSSDSKKANLPLRGVIKGPVSFEINTLIKNNKEKPSMLKLKGKSDQMTFDDVQRNLVLMGNVFIDTDQEHFCSTLNADKAVFTFDQDYQILDMELDGNSGHTTLIPKKTT